MHAASPIGSAARSRAQLCTSRPAPLVPQQAAHCAQQRKRQLPPPAALPAAATAAAAAAAAAAAPAALAQPLVELAEALDEAPVWTLDQAVGLVFGGLLLLLYLSSSQVCGMMGAEKGWAGGEAVRSKARQAHNACHAARYMLWKLAGGQRTLSCSILCDVGALNVHRRAAQRTPIKRACPSALLLRLRSLPLVRTLPLAQPFALPHRSYLLFPPASPPTHPPTQITGRQVCGALAAAAAGALRGVRRPVRAGHLPAARLPRAERVTARALLPSSVPLRPCCCLFHI